MLRMLSLCSGIGGADLAAEVTGHIEVVGQVEVDPFCQAVLAKHWPDVKRMGDIREVAGHEFGSIDIVVGGIPCQPHSLAGKRKSSADDRNLWPEFYRIVCAVRPKWIVVENVLGLLSSEGGAFFGAILRDLANAGYDAEWHVLRAADVGAPHERKRVFLVAYSGFDRQWQREIQYQRRTECEAETNSGNDGAQGIMADAYNKRLQEFDVTGIAGTERQHGRNVSTFRPSRQLESRIRRGINGFPSWIHRHQWPARPGEPQGACEPARTTVEKGPYRNQRLKALGNAIVPQQIYPLFKAIVDMETSNVCL